jgi:hypothetical protein
MTLALGLQQKYFQPVKKMNSNEMLQMSKTRIPSFLKTSDFAQKQLKFNKLDGSVEKKQQQLQEMNVEKRDVEFDKAKNCCDFNLFDVN